MARFWCAVRRAATAWAGHQAQSSGPTATRELLRPTAAAVAGAGAAWLFWGAGGAAHASSRWGISSGFKKYELLDVIELTHDTKCFRFALEDGQEFSLPASCTVQFRFLNFDERGEVLRHYTPVTPNGTVGYFDIIVKKLKGGYATGKLWHLKPGDSVTMRRQTTKLKYSANMYKTVCMIAGGVGITPMLHLIHTSLQDPEDETKLILLFMNKSQADIILREDLEALQKKHPDRFKLHLMIDRPEPGWNGLTGYANPALLDKVFPKPSRHHLVCVCGPDPMVDAVVGIAKNIFAWSKTRGTQPSYPEAANSGPVSGALGALGWMREYTDMATGRTHQQVYVF